MPYLRIRVNPIPKPQIEILNNHHEPMASRNLRVASATPPVVFLDGAVVPVPMHKSSTHTRANSSYAMNCLYAWCCPLCACVCSHPSVRGEIRNKLNLPEEPCGDCLVSCYCFACAICQEMNEINAPPCGSP